jgi:fatty acid desaturase
VWQAASTIVSYGVLWGLMHRSVAVSYWITLALAILAAGFLVRLFIIFHVPKVLQWFTGNIGFHHIHHLSPGIPNYNLEKCHKADPLLQGARHITLLDSLKSISYRLWDEQRQKWVGYGELRTLRRDRPGGST